MRCLWCYVSQFTTNKLPFLIINMSWFKLLSLLTSLYTKQPRPLFSLFSVFSNTNFTEFELRSLEKKESTMTTWTPPPRSKFKIFLVSSDGPSFHLVWSLSRKFFCLWAVVVKWSSCLPPTPTIQVKIPVNLWYDSVPENRLKRAK